MLQTPVCDLLGISVPIISAPFGPWDSVDLAAAVCEAGGIGSLGTATRTADELREQWRRLRALTARPFIVNHTGRPFSPEAFDATLTERSKAISFHMGVPAELVRRAHDHGILWLQTVGDLESAEQALEAGADALIAQGGEAGGNSGWVATTVLVPAVVDLAGDVPVIASGGIADGRGIAAAIALGAQGVQLGTRFLATPEMRIDESWKQRIVAEGALSAVKVENAERVMPPFNLPQIGPKAAPRALETDFIRQLRDAPESFDPREVGPMIVAAVRAGGGHDLMPFTGQSVELVRDIVPAGELVRRLVREAEDALRAAQGAIRA
ncbi:MAG TPA: nitronate monooxygenase [Dehalococcoidia bacterium]|nr:nitronate monooxygenase [Dehalococcoidia bacterium]